MRLETQRPILPSQQPRLPLFLQTRLGSPSDGDKQVNLEF
jgi:hypothetical protein